MQNEPRDPLNDTSEAKQQAHPYDHTADELCIHFRNILRTPGVLHTVHGAVADTLQVLACGTEFIRQRTRVWQLLRRP